ncbi:cupin domain-containing protein [Pseudomonas sp. BGr12]|uniref:cupin domain-containing protein n=1 Tax=Pseudomonas sp. BGr12 TaxID=2936269 RepID=UPI00255987D1|nr:cupin domain-containing protein [Pseudomonas sp. BJa5]MDL2428432.1 cupin domain-containing protein [Pseudomonas sp. BJa5]
MNSKVNSVLFGLASMISLSAANAEDTLKISNIDIHRLDSAPSQVVEGAEYMTVVKPKGSTVKAVRVFESSDGKLTSDLAEYEPVDLVLKNWPIDEFMYILEGKLQITDEKGNSKIYGPGDSFVVPKGFSGTWHQLSKIKKITVNYER